MVLGFDLVFFRQDVRAIGKFEMQSVIRYDSVRHDSTLTFPALMQYVQEVSIQNTESTQFPMKWLIENNLGWVITHWDVIIHSYPKYNETITLRTWPSLFKGFLGERSYEAVSLSGQKLLTANSSWVFTDLVKRRPLRPTKEHTDSYGELFPPAQERNLVPSIKQKIMGGELVLHSENNMRVTRRDIDTNGHVNNTNYFVWIFDIIPEEKYKYGKVSKMKTVYRKECLLGDNVKIEYFENPDNKNESAARIANDDVVLTEVFLDWE